jgi:drug/metabolite transporter (DMT)-like permease
VPPGAASRTGALWAVAAATCYSLSSVVGKDLLGELGVASLLLWRFTVASAVLLVALAVRSWRRASQGAVSSGLNALTPTDRDPSMRHAWFHRPAVRMVLLGVWFGAMVFVGFAGLDRLDASVSIVLVYLYPVFVVVGSAALGVRPSPATWVALALVVSGVVLTVPELIFGGDVEIDVFGVVLVLSQALLFASYMIVNSRVGPALDGLEAATWTMVGGSLFIIPIALSVGIIVPDRPVLVLEVALFALIPSVVATVCFFAALRHLSAPLVAMILPLEVVLAILWSVLFLGEELRAVEAVGAAVVVSGVVLAQWFAQRPPPNHSIQASAEVGLNT